MATIDASAAPQRHQQFLETKHFANLDVLRAVSVLAVVWHHTAAAAFVDGPSILQQGHYGVDFFFAISGFLITTLLLREFRRNGTISYRRFLGRRALRIFPLYYTVLAAYVVLTVATRSGTPEAAQFFDNLPAFATYTSNWFVDLEQGTAVTFYFAWSLATEEQFYLFWPPLLALMLSRSGGAVRGAVIAVLSIIAVNRIAVEVLEGDSLALTIARSLSLPMLLGVLGALAADRASGFRPLVAVLGRRWTLPVLLVALTLLLIDAQHSSSIEVVLVLVVIACCLPTAPRFGASPVLRPLARVGIISYGIYLMHMLAANAVRPVVGRDQGVIVFLAASIAVVVAAEISYRYFESRLLVVKERHFSSTLQPSATAAST